MRLSVWAVLCGLVLLTLGCSGSASVAGSQDATATTFMTDRATIDGLRSMVSDANGASLFAASGAGASQAADCAATWNSIRDRMAVRDRNAVAAIDAAVAQLRTATAARDAVGASAASATIAVTAADYANRFP